MTDATDLVAAVAALSDVLARTAFPLPASSAWSAERDRRELTGQLADYVIPGCAVSTRRCWRWSAGRRARGSRR